MLNFFPPRPKKSDLNKYLIEIEYRQVISIELDKDGIYSIHYSLLPPAFTAYGKDSYFACLDGHLERAIRHPIVAEGIRERIRETKK
jgi:hypothetical protein